MTSVNGLETFPTYAEQAEDLYPSIEQLSQNTAENYSRGFQPLETLPAKWYNSMIHALTKQAEETKLVVDSIYAELKNIIEAAGLSLTGTDPKQLLKAVKALVAASVPIASATAPGVVVSSSADWKVAVGADGVMSVNTTSATTTAPGLVKLNSATNSTSETEAATPAAVKAAYDLADSKYTAANATTSAAGLVKLTSSGWGLSSADGTVRTVYAGAYTPGIVMLSNSTSSNSTSDAATSKAVKAAYDLADSKYTAANATTTTAGLVKLTSSGWGLSDANGTVRTVAAKAGSAGVVSLIPEANVGKVWGLKDATGGISTVIATKDNPGIMKVGRLNADNSPVSWSVYLDSANYAKVHTVNYKYTSGASQSIAGLVPECYALFTETFLRGDGTWARPSSVSSADYNVQGIAVLGAVGYANKSGVAGRLFL